jgi:hypothetical protein
MPCLDGESSHYPQARSGRVRDHDRERPARLFAVALPARVVMHGSESICMTVVIVKTESDTRTAPPRRLGRNILTRPADYSLSSAARVARLYVRRFSGYGRHHPAHSTRAASCELVAAPSQLANTSRAADNMDAAKLSRLISALAATGLTTTAGARAVVREVDRQQRVGRHLDAKSMRLPATLDSVSPKAGHCCDWCCD